MQFKIFNPTKEAKEEDKKIFFRLEEDDGEILLVASDESGRDMARVLAINASGTLSLIGCIDRDTGLQLNNEGVIKLSYGSFTPEKENLEDKKEEKPSSSAAHFDLFKEMAERFGVKLGERLRKKCPCPLCA